MSRRAQRDMEAALTVGALAREMRPRLAAIEAAVTFEAQRWPYGDFLPVLRTTETPSGDVVECGMLRRGDGPVVTVAAGMPVSYESFEAMAVDGWRPD